MNQKLQIPFYSGDLTADLQATTEYLDGEPELSDRIGALMWAYKTTSDLFPQTVETFVRGSYFPFVESETEMSNAYMLAQCAMYRYAFTALRIALELGLLSVYWDRDDESRRTMTDWLRSSKPTPSMRQIRDGLQEIPAVQRFEATFGFDAWVRSTYKRLNNYIHVRGSQYSTRAMNRANFPRFDPGTFRSWCDSFDDVVRIVATAHLLGYPIGLQETPVEEKFGLEGPMGGFLNPGQASRITSVLPAEHADLLQEISDNDAPAVDLARSIREMPDLSEDEWERQAERQDRFTIENQGFIAWYEQWSSIYEDAEHNSPEAVERFHSRAESLRSWAAENDLTDHGRFPPVQPNRSQDGR